MPTSTLPQCAVMLLDFAGTGDETARHPAVVRKRAHRLLANVLRGLQEESRLAIESGTDAVVCFVGDPQDALHAALLLRDQVVHQFKSKLSVRVALNLGDVDVADGGNDRLNVTGEGIDHAVRVKELAGPNEVLASPSFHRRLAQLNPERAARFVDHAPGDPLSPKVYAPGPDAARPREFTRHLDVTPGELNVIQHTLQRFIGPLALALMQREIEACQRFAEFIHALAAAIADAQQRTLFLQSLQLALPERQL